MNSEKTISTNPFTGAVIASFQQDTPTQVTSILNRSETAYSSWKRKSVLERSRLLLPLAAVLRSNKAQYALSITQEMGKPFKESLAEIEKCAWVCEYYADKAHEFLAPRALETDLGESFVRYDPLGVILGIMPWNYPFWQVFRFAAPTLTAGNTVLLKHASNVWQCASHIASAIEEAGYPDGVFQNLYISSSETNSVIENPIIQGVSITGSTAAGASVAAKAGSRLKKSVLELGGHNALLVFDDANMEQALDICIQARFQNSGQSCIAGKRLFLQKSIFESFTEQFCARVQSLVCGDPMKPETEVSVMARPDLAEGLYTQLKESVQMGAKILIGGRRDGAFFQPTVLGNVVPGMPVFDEETFGPLIGITSFETEEEMLELLSLSDYGLGVLLFTEDRERVHRLLPIIEEGAIFVNALVKSDPRWPFGGIKASGYGRELGREGILEFVNPKTVHIAPWEKPK